MQDECIFCRIVQGDLPSHKIFENDRVVAFLDINPVNPGHTLLIPKTHAERFEETSEEDVHALVDAAKLLAPAILKAVSSDAYNLTTNSGRAAGQVVFHTHVHFIPRFPSDGHEMWGAMETTPDLAAIAGRIKEQLA